MIGCDRTIPDIEDEPGATDLERGDEGSRGEDIKLGIVDTTVLRCNEGSDVQERK